MTKELDMWAKDKDVQTQLLDEEKRTSGICQKEPYVSHKRAVHEP